jgi:hypothetical protein
MDGGPALGLLSAMITPAVLIYPAPPGGARWQGVIGRRVAEIVN